jgi:hypothetical protein
MDHHKIKVLTSLQELNVHRAELLNTLFRLFKICWKVTTRNPEL